mmetsp:Transcript_26666/g.52185  ORF Transcript_26666/g.52185 Transcript_26666/m.52185 type:complete len:101 (+) Transcript_26666:73-375(+)
MPSWANSKIGIGEFGQPQLGSPMITEFKSQLYEAIASNRSVVVQLHKTRRVLIKTWQARLEQRDAYQGKEASRGHLQEGHSNGWMDGRSTTCGAKSPIKT